MLKAGWGPTPSDDWIVFGSKAIKEVENIDALKLTGGSPLSDDCIWWRGYQMAGESMLEADWGPSPFR